MLKCVDEHVSLWRHIQMNSCTQYVNKQASSAKHNASSPEEVLQKMYSEWCGKKYLIKTRMVKYRLKQWFKTIKTN